MRRLPLAGSGPDGTRRRPSAVVLRPSMSRGAAVEPDRLASDGVSCTVCHQIAPDGLGSPASFNGNFVVRPPRADGVRAAFGPFDVDAGRHTIMRSVTGFEQVEAAHVRQSELCASCHTLVTQGSRANRDFA